MKKILIFLSLLLILFGTIPVNASVNTYPRDENNLGISSDIEVTSENKSFILNTPKVDASEKIYDFALLFNDLEEDYLYQKVINYINKTNYDLAVVTISNNPKSSWKGQGPTTVYADDFHDYNDFNKNGIVILIDMHYREYYISTSGEVILMYDDDRIDGLLDAAESNMISGNYYGAMVNIIEKLNSYYDEGIPESNKYCEINSDDQYVCHKKVPYLMLAIISGVITAILVFIISSSYKKIRKSSNADKYIENDKINIDRRVDQYLRSKTTKEKIYHSSSSSGGFGGGSSHHSSSSGRSHGGGGRRF